MTFRIIGEKQMNIYGIKFREKASSIYISVLIQADSEEEASKKFYESICKDDFYDVDKKTISWTGASIPLSSRGEPLILYTNLDGAT